MNNDQRITEIEAEIERLTEAQRWIPVTEKLPEHRRSVLVYCPEPNNIYCGDYHGKEDDVFRDTGKWYYFGQGLMREIDEKITHWMPIPVAPEKKLYETVNTELEAWPDWKKRAYNDNFAIGAHTKKLEVAVPEEGE